MNLIAKVAELKRQHELAEMGDAIFRLTFARNMMNAAPAMLDALGLVRAGDADIIADVLKWHVPDSGEEGMAECLKRYQELARLMEASK